MGIKILPALLCWLYFTRDQAGRRGETNRNKSTEMNNDRFRSKLLNNEETIDGLLWCIKTRPRPINLIKTSEILSAKQHMNAQIITIRDPKHTKDTSKMVLTTSSVYSE
jgi:hypothetical protein